jgi:hypothetical protein
VTLLSGTTAVHTADATLGPVTINPGGAKHCHFKGYWVSAELRQDGSLNYHLLS